MNRILQPQFQEKPRRIQRKRTKGWRMPDGAVYVGRPSFWGNPFSEPSLQIDDFLDWYEWWLDGELRADWHNWPLGTEQKQRIEELRGHDLACWCPLDKPCHADVLLRLANAGSAP